MPFGHHSLEMRSYLGWLPQLREGIQNLFLFARFFLLFEKVLQFVHKLPDVLELPIDGGETDISHTIQLMKLFHNLLAYLRTLDLLLPLLLEVEFDAIDDLLDKVNADRPLLAGPSEAIEDLEAIEGLPPSVLLDDQGKIILWPLARGKTLLAAETFPSPADGLLVSAQAGVDHFALGVITERTFHFELLLSRPRDFF